MSFRVNTNIQAMTALRNLGTTSDKFSGSVARLSSGLRITSGADDPAGLQISEGFRAQIASIAQANRNNQDAINYSKTAEGAMDEMSTLLRDAKALAIANGNDATLSSSQKQANQNQLNSIITSINRIASQTQFGTRKLLDGSAGINVAVVNKGALESVSMSGNVAGNSITANDTVNVVVGTAAVKATVTGATVTLANAVGADGKLTINGVTFNVSSSMTNQELMNTVNGRSADTGVIMSHNGTAFVYTATNYGTASNSIQITNDTATIGFTTAGTRTLGSGTAGVNAAATFSLATAGYTTGSLTASSADGRTFSDTYGNVFKLTTTTAAAAATTNGIAAISAGAAKFQIGGNVGQTVNLSLSSMDASALSLTSLDITTSAGSTAAQTAIENAIQTVASRRGDVGNFMRNILESNLRSLSVAQENLTASESTIRDADVAEEMTQYTKLQILQQSGISVLAQANQAPQQILSLLRG
ncbi:MAG: hypothetical protein JST40_12310 [Armatimonadetes bacterium]|nr:hypothetical protein [Armatimonadota bacterium]